MKLSQARIALCLLIWSSTGSAAVITITEAEVADGKLIVTGRTPTADQNVTLDGRFTVKSNAALADRKVQPDLRVSKGLKDLPAHRPDLPVVH